MSTKPIPEVSQSPLYDLSITNPDAFIKKVQELTDILAETLGSRDDAIQFMKWYIEPGPVRMNYLRRPRFTKEKRPRISKGDGNERPLNEEFEEFKRTHVLPPSSDP